MRLFLRGGATCTAVSVKKDIMLILSEIGISGSDANRLTLKIQKAKACNANASRHLAHTTTGYDVIIHGLTLAGRTSVTSGFTDKIATLNATTTAPLQESAISVINAARHLSAFAITLADPECTPCPQSPLSGAKASRSWM